MNRIIQKITLAWGFVMLPAMALAQVEAKLDALVQSSDQALEASLGEFGGKASRTIKLLAPQGVELSRSESGIRLDFDQAGSLRVSPSVLQLPVSWKGYGELEFILESARTGTIELAISGTTSRIQQDFDLSDGIQEFSLDVRETALIGGLESKPVYIEIISPEPQRIHLRGITLHRAARVVPLVDQWGQRSLSDYAQKVASLDELKNDDAEHQWLAGLPPMPVRDKFGGFLNHDLDTQKTGFFHVEKHHGRWMLVTPAGNPFYSIGLNGVRLRSTRSTADVTRVTGREWVFEDLPALEECRRCFYSDPNYFSFYSWNILRKDGHFDAWRSRTEDRLHALGFNTIGNWSDVTFFDDAKIPYTYTLDTRKREDLLMSNGMPDVFNPAWISYVDEVFDEISRQKDDPYLLGYFVDNEMSWRSIPRLDPESDTFAFLDGKTDEEKMRIYAEQYFAVVHNTMEEKDPNHLYLGCRFTRNLRGIRPVAEAAGKYVDVLSVNVYAAVPIREQMDEWHQLAGKPILIGEHHIPTSTPKQLPPRWPTWPEPERSEMVKEYVLTWAEFPYALGSHWYQFKDQELAGRGDGGENQPVGIVTITDKINRDIALTFHEVGMQIEDIVLRRGEP